ncbi:MAG: Ig-like domain-containing protein, partial [Flavobacterium sp.]
KNAATSSGPTAAPTPTLASNKVISMFSNAYTNVPVDTWRTGWSDATLEEIVLGGNDTKKYSNLNFVGIEATSTQIDATAMTHFHTDVYSSDFTTFKIKLVDFGPDGKFAGGDDKEHEITIDAPAKDSWVSLDIALSSFTGLTTRAHIAQLIYVGAPSGKNTVLIDNVYFHN